MRLLHFVLVFLACNWLAACSSTPTREMTNDEISYYSAQDEFEYPVARKIPPIYPVSAVKNQVSGQVVLSYKINGKGKTTDIKVLESTPAGVFDKTAIRAIASWQYKEIVKDDYQLERSDRKTRFVFSSTSCDQTNTSQLDDIPTVSVCGYRKRVASAK